MGILDLGAYCLIPSVKLLQSYVGSVDESDEPALVQVANDVSDQVEEFTERQFISRSWSVRLSGSGNQRLALPHYPVQVVTSCYTDVDDTYEIPVASLVHDIGAPESGFLHARDGYGFPKGDRNVHLTYVTAYKHEPTAQDLTDGFLQLPHALIGVTLRLAARFWKRRVNLGLEVVEKDFGGSTIRYLDDELTPRDKRVLEGYKRMNGAWHI